MKKLLTFLICIIAFPAQSQSVQGEVMRKEAFKKNGNIYTKNLVNGVEIITRGGVMGLEAEHVSHTPQLYKGQKGIFKYNTKKELLEVVKTNNSSLANINISPTNASAGENNIITITGQSFGDRNTVSFANANYGGALYSEALDSQILSWSDDEIQVEVPDFAGTGTVKVTLQDDTVYESDVLTIPYAIININSSASGANEAYRTQHVDDNGQGGYTWQYTESFDRRNEFQDAIDTWRCESGINWLIGDDTSENVIADDGINIVMISDESLGSVLGRCTSRFRGCFVDGKVKWYVTEMDIIFNGARDWSQTDFKTVAIHELGHGHQLGHVIDPSEIMHYSLGSGAIKHDLSNGDKQGALSVQELSTNTTVCSNDAMTDYQCTLSDEDFRETAIIYPNPTKGKIYINKPYDKIEVFDLIGRKLLESNDISRLKKGMYIIKITIENNIQYFKLIKN